MLGIYVNEMQRSINGLGGRSIVNGAGGYYDSRITPYGDFRSYHPSDARGQFGQDGSQCNPQTQYWDPGTQQCLPFSTVTPTDGSQCNPQTQYWDPGTQKCLPFTATPTTPTPAAATAAATAAAAAKVPWYKNWKVWAGVGAVVVVAGGVGLAMRRPKHAP